MKIPSKVKLCTVTKYYSISEVEEILRNFPDTYCIAENRWPDCQEKFQYFNKILRHFIGPLQSNKVRKILPLVDCIQSIHSEKLLRKVDQVAAERNKQIEVYLQVNISNDPDKQGFSPEEALGIVQDWNYPNTKLTGLMTIGAQSSIDQRRQYFRKMRQLFDKINKIHPLENLSMGMSEDYQIAIEEGATMVRLGKILQEG